MKVVIKNAHSDCETFIRTTSLDVVAWSVELAYYSSKPYAGVIVSRTHYRPFIAGGSHS